MDFFFFRTSIMQRGLEAAGLEIEEALEREPYAPEVEYQSRRAYIFARKRAARRIDETCEKPTQDCAGFVFSWAGAKLY
jgi:hypothetical protein